MAKLTVVLFLIGVAGATGLAVWQYSLAPQGTLLYTPAPGATPNFTPSAAVGFFVAALGLSFVSASVVILSAVWGSLFNRRLYLVTKQAVFLLVGFGLLCVLTALTQNFWP